jgi:hypothetical protein
MIADIDQCRSIGHVGLTADLRCVCKRNQRQTGGRVAAMRTNRTCAAAANAHAEIARMPSITRLLTQHVSPNRTFKQVEPG